MHRKKKRIEYRISLPKKFMSFLGDKTVKNILDVGCGYGRTCFFLHEHHYNVIGVDVDRARIKLALKDVNSLGINKEMNFLVNDARYLCFRESSFDAVTVLGVLTLIPKTDRPEIINEIVRVLKPLGYVFVEEFGQTWENPIYSKRYKEDYSSTRELGTFTVKDNDGRILHQAHHFTREEMFSLLTNFKIISFEEDTFTSYYHKNWVKGYVIIAQKTV